MRQFIADKAYDANDLRDFLAAQGTEAVISPMPGRLTPLLFDPVAYRMRNLVERAFCKLKDWPPHRNPLRQDRPQFPRRPLPRRPRHPLAPMSPRPSAGY